MSEAVSMQELLDADLSEFQDRIKLPVGDYIATCLENESGESSQKKTPFLAFKFRVEGPASDAISEEDYQAAVASNAGDPITLTATQYLTPKTMTRFREFLEALQCYASDDGLSTIERIENTKGQTCIIRVKHRTIQGSDGGEARSIEEIGGFRKYT